MKKLVVLAVASLIATSANAAEMKWSGDAGWRYSQTKHDDNLTSRLTIGSLQPDTSIRKTKTHQVRASLGATGGWENVEWGVGVRTGQATHDYYVNVINGTDRALGLSQAWFRYLRDIGAVDFSVTVGRQKNVFAYDDFSQNLFDNDVNFDGFGWQFKFGMFGLNAGQYITGAKSNGAENAAGSSFTRTDATAQVASTRSQFNYFLGFQPYMNWKFSDSIETMFAVGYYLWSDNSNSNTMGGGLTTFNTGNVPAVAPNTFNVHNLRQWQFLNKTSLPYKLTFHGELVMAGDNQMTARTVPAYLSTLAYREVSATAWSAGLEYGSLRRAHDFTLGYAYGKKGIASMVGRYSYESFLPDNEGHKISLGYALADNFHLGSELLFLKEVERINWNTGLPYAQQNVNQQMHTTYWEVTAGVMF